MAHLLNYRKGWQSEHLARYILSKFSFVAEPLNISDDIGSDFYCTLFEISEGKFLLPKNSFAIQIKSKKMIDKEKNKIEVTKLISYLWNLKIPYFLGVVNRDTQNLEIYSGEAIDPLIALGCKDLTIELVEKRDSNPLSFLEDRHCIAKFPKIIEINTKFDYETDSSKINELTKVCEMIQKNISSRISQEYIFENYDKTVSIIAGNGSYGVFRENFFRRLAEAFYNLKWVIESKGKLEKNDLDEVALYKKIHVDLVVLYKSSPVYLLTIIEELDATIQGLKK